MAIVVDTSAVIAVAGNEPSKPRLIELTRNENLIAAATLPWEVGNAVTAMFKQRRVTLSQGLGLIEQYRRISIELRDVSLEDSVRLAARLNIYAYDAYVLQCARDNSAPILTLDGGLKEAAKREGISVLEIA